MRVSVSIIDPEQFTFDLSPSYANKKPCAHATLKDVARLDVHGADNEQIACAFDTGLIDRIQVIVERDNGAHPFITFDVAIPGVSIKYFWTVQHQQYSDAVGVLVGFGEMLHTQGVDAPISRLKRLAGIADE